MDLNTGRLIHIDEKIPEVGKETVNICPMAPGSKDWQPSSFSPRTGLIYIPHENMCMDEQYNEANYIPGTPYIGATVRYYAGSAATAVEIRVTVFKLRARHVAQSHSALRMGQAIVACMVIFSLPAIMISNTMADLR